MPTKVFDTAEAVIVGGSSIFALSNLQSVLGIIILCLNLGLIVYKIYYAIKKARKGDDAEDVEEAVQTSIDMLQNLIDRQKKEEDDVREDTGKE